VTAIFVTETLATGQTVTPTVEIASVYVIAATASKNRVTTARGCEPGC